MIIIDALFVVPFEVVIDLCYKLTENFGFALILFTFFTRIVLFPISFISHKNSIRLLKIQPLINDIKARHSGEIKTILNEQKILFKKEKYSTLKGLLPVVFQLIIIIGVIGAVNNAIKNDKYSFAFGWLDLSVIPTINSIYVIIPLFSAASAFLLCFIQNAFNPLTRTQGFLGRWGTTLFLVVFSCYFAFVCQAGIGLYWIAGNAFGTIITLLCVSFYNPKKYVNVENITINSRTKKEKQEIKKRKQAEKLREKEDVENFYKAKKQLVFYSEASGYYKYFKHFIDYILANSDITVYYITSDMDDQIFKMNHPRFKAYFCGANGLITLFMKMDADVVVMTLPDLEKYHYKRSLVRKDIEYIYTDHGFGSVNLVYKKGALDYFDTIFCGGKTYNEEIRETEKVYKLPEKNLVNVGFGLFDTLIEEYNALNHPPKKKPQILIAPSWQKDNILEYCLDELLGGLPGDIYSIIVRPHPEFIKRFPAKMSSIINKYSNGDVEIQTDFSSNYTVYSSDLIITDWSSIAQEFSFITKKPSLFINTPMKIMNPEWKMINVEPIDIWIRNEIGISIDVENLSYIGSFVMNLINSVDDYQEKISRIFNEYVYNAGHSAEVGGKYIINKIKEKNNEQISNT